MIAPSMTTPALTYFHSATSSLRERDDERLLHAAAGAMDPFFEPQGQRRLRLMAQPQPGEFDEGGSQSWVPGFGNTLLAINRSALPGVGASPA